MIVLTTTLGLEGAVSLEVKNFGYRLIDSQSGRVFVDAGFEDIPFFNIFSRTAERVLYLLGEFQAESFEELYENIKSCDFSMIPPGSRVEVTRVRTYESKLYSKRAVQSVTMKAVADSIKVDEGELFYPLHIYIRKNRAMLLLDATGKDGLHKRGYRKLYSKAPLRETIAASLLTLSRYAPDKILLDPFCGSGTIPAEAYMMANSIAPGKNRKFLSESWPDLEKIYKDMKEKARDSEVSNSPTIICSDIDGEILKVARENFKRLNAKIRIIQSDFRSLELSYETGKIVANPPYGMRLQSGIWKDMKKLFKRFGNWEIHIIAPFKDIQKISGRPPDKTTPFFNSGVKVFFQQFYRHLK